MRFRLVALSLTLLCLGCYPAGESDSAHSERQTEAPEKAENHSVASTRAAARQRIFSQLTSHSWTTDVLDQLHPDRTVYRFRADGTYRIDFLTDYDTTPGQGAWNFQGDADGTWWLIFDNGQREQFRLNDDRTLTFLNNKLKPDEPLEQSQALDQLAPVTVPEAVQKVVDHLSANPWRLSNDLNLYRTPTLVEFHPDWTYRTSYRDDECHNQGRWFATTRPLIPESRVAPIQGDSPLSKCDTRGPRPEHLDVEMLDGIGLLINGELYVPQATAKNRAVIWALFGRSQHIRVSVEYDMPIRQGVPHRFDVEFTIVDRAMSEITLQRFSLTDTFDQSFRLANHDLGHVVEIAATDLKRKVLGQGEVHKASLTATFQKLGTQFVYFNAMMYDDLQDWDIRCAYELRVSPGNDQ